MKNHISVLIDLSNAFDTASHCVLLFGMNYRNLFDICLFIRECLINTDSRLPDFCRRALNRPNIPSCTLPVMFCCERDVLDFSFCLHVASQCLLLVPSFFCSNG